MQPVGHAGRLVCRKAPHATKEAPFIGVPPSWSRQQSTSDSSLGGMTTVFLGERPKEVQDWLERRRALGQDRYDEVWEGEYHVVPGPHGWHASVDDQITRCLGPRARSAGLHGGGALNLGDANDYRVPDHVYLRQAHWALYNPTAAVVVEIVSPGDESRRKFDFYFRSGVEELLIVDPRARTVEWFVRGDGRFEPSPRSSLLDVSADELAAELDWPG